MADIKAAVAAQLSSSLGVTNTTAGTAAPTVNLQFGSYYGMIASEKPGEESRFKNSTGPADAREIISYRTRPINSVNSYNKIYYPARVTSGEEFGIRLDEVLRTKDENGFIIADEPIVLSVSFKAPLSNNMTNDVLEEVFQRFLGAIPVDSDGKHDWMQIMTGTTNPLMGVASKG